MADFFLHTAPYASPAFGEIRVTARSHFQLHFYAAVYRVLRHLHYLETLGSERLDALFEKYPFLASYLNEILQVMPPETTWADGLVWWRDQITGWEEQEEHLPLRTLAEAEGLSWHSRLAFVLIGLVEEDSRFGTVFAELQAPLPHRRACLELVGQMLMDDGLDLDPWAVCRPLLQAGLVDVINPEAPRSEWVLRMPDLLWDAARGEVAHTAAGWCTYHEAGSFPGIQDLVFPAAFLQRMAQVPALVQEGKAGALVVRGTRGSERLAVVGAAARALGRDVIVAQGGGLEPYATRLGPLCTMTRALPVLEYELLLGDTVEVPALVGYHGPVAFVVGYEGGLRGEALAKAVTLSLPPLRRSERLRHWEAAFRGYAVENLDQINERFYLPGLYIRQAAAAAVAQAALAGRQRLRAEDVREACRTLNRQLLDTLAKYLEGEGNWGQLVVDDTARLKLRELERRCRHRERLLEHLGSAFGGGTNRGVRALFSGPSGTGKTLAAKILAAELGMDLYRVDLAAVVNKYIGETEKNLHRVLSVAEELDVVLLLDEGDALLGGRTSVRSANDRYANLETNYLLQRLEQFQGIVIVTTNLGENIDRAFQRRIDVSVEFLPPDAEERWHIWQIHLPQAYAPDDPYLQDVAVRCTMTGAQIRNAALLATLLALDEGEEQVGRRHVEAAVRSEYQKAGATCPLDTGTQGAPRQGGVEAFLNALE